MDGHDRPLSKVESWTGGDGSPSFVRRWRVERDGAGRITRLDLSPGDETQAAWPAWDELAYVYTRVAGPQHEYVRITDAVEEVNLVFDPPRSHLYGDGGADVDSITVLRRDLYGIIEGCKAAGLGPESCPDLQVMADVPLRGSPLDVATARVVGWDDSGGPTRVVWLPGLMGGDLVMDADFFAGEERLSYDRLDRLKTDQLLSFSGRAGRRITYAYSAGCEDVARDWSHEPATCPRQLDMDFWFGWPVL